MRSQKLLYIVLIAFVLRLLALYVVGSSVLKFGDAPDYLSAATNLCVQGSYPEKSSLPFFRAPGLPLFIAAVTVCNTGAIRVVKVALAAVGAISVGLIFLLARELLYDLPSSLLAASLAAIYPFFIVQASDVQTEGLFMFLLLGAVWLTLRSVRTGLALTCLLAGLCAGSAALVRPVGLVLLAFLPWPVRRKLWQILSLAAGICLSMGPWVIRNEIRFHEPIIVNDAGGYNFWRGTSNEMAAIGRIADPREFTKASIQFETVTSPGIAREIDRTATSPSARSREWYKRALRNFEQTPGAFMAHLARNAWVYWRPWLNPQTQSRTVVLGSGIMVALLYIFGIFGFILLKKRSRGIALWLAGAMIAFWILQIPFQVVSRFRVPITDPFLIILAAAAYSHRRMSLK